VQELVLDAFEQEVVREPPIVPALLARDRFLGGRKERQAIARPVFGKGSLIYESGATQQPNNYDCGLLLVGQVAEVVNDPWCVCVGVCVFVRVCMCT
jgi:hypothetical protein